MDYQGKIVLVTGGARHLGCGIALGLAGLGCDVALTYRTSKDRAEELVGMIQGMGLKSFAYKTDVTNPAQVQALIKDIRTDLGNVDILINCVGDYFRANAKDTNPDDWQQVFQSNLTSAYLTSREVAGPMMENKWGRIINLGFASTSQLRARPGITAYTAAKSALVSFTRSMALEVAAGGVTVNVINLGYFEHEDTPKEEHQLYAPTIPVGRLGTVEELSSLVCFLVSDDAAYLTGNALELSGGFGI